MESQRLGDAAFVKIVSTHRRCGPQIIGFGQLLDRRINGARRGAGIINDR
jgi:hypothetical protein